LGLDGCLNDSDSIQAPGHCNTEKLYIIRLSSHKDRMR
jgi:hypothetical protein